MQEMHVQFALTESEFTEFLAHAKPSGDPRSTRDTLISFALFLLLLYGTPFLVDFFVPAPAAPSEPLVKRLILFASPWCYVLLWLKIMSPRYRRYAANAAWSNSPATRAHKTGIISDTGILLQSAYGSDTHPWLAIQRFIETPSLFVFATSSRTFVLVPKRALPPQTDLNLFRHEMTGRINSMRLPPEEFAAQQPADDEPLLLPRLLFTLTSVDLMNAKRTHSPRDWTSFLHGFVIFLIIVAFQWVMMVFWRQTSSASFFVILAAYMAVFVLFEFFLNQWRWKKSPHLHGPQAVEVRESGLRFESSNRSETLGWGALNRHLQGKRVFVLVCRDNSIRIIPKTAFLAPDSVEQFETLLRERIQPIAGFAVLPATAAS